MGTVPIPPTFVAGQILTSAHLTAITAVQSFWANPPQCLAYQTSATTCTTGVYTLLPLQAESFDVVQAGDSPSHDNVTNNSRVVFRTPGKYQVTGQVVFTTSSVGARQVDVRLNAAGSSAGGTRVAFTSQSPLASVVTAVPLPLTTITVAAGDYLEMFGYQTSGGNLDTLAGIATYTFLNIRFIAS